MEGSWPGSSGGHRRGVPPSRCGWSREFLRRGIRPPTGGNLGMVFPRPASAGHGTAVLTDRWERCQGPVRPTSGWHPDPGGRAGGVPIRTRPPPPPPPRHYLIPMEGPTASECSSWPGQTPWSGMGETRTLDRGGSILQVEVQEIQLTEGVPAWRRGAGSHRPIGGRNGRWMEGCTGDVSRLFEPAGLFMPWRFVSPPPPKGIPGQWRR